jgi:hypothetical protein
MQKSDQFTASPRKLKLEVTGPQPTLPLASFVGFVVLASAMAGVFVWIVIYGAAGG